MDSNTGLLDWKPGFDQAGVYEIKVKAESPVTSSSHIFSDVKLMKIEVKNVNRPPELISIGNQEVDEGEDLLVNSDNTPSGDQDIDGEALSFSCFYDTEIDGSVNSGNTCDQLSSLGIIPKGMKSVGPFSVFDSINLQMINHYKY